MTRIASLRRLAIANTRARPAMHFKPAARRRDPDADPEPTPVIPGPISPALGGGAAATID